MKLNIILLAACIMMPIIAYSQQDTLSTHLLDEVVVTAKNHQAVNNGVAYIPTQSDKQHSSNYLDLLGQMMVPGLRVDIFNGTVESSWGGKVHYFIDGQEAPEWQIKAIRPKEVVKVEFLLSPPEPQYKQYQSVINFVLHHYNYGGYIYADGAQGFINNNGSYSISAKLKKHKFTWQGSGGAYYRRSNDIINNQTTDFNYGNGYRISKISQGIQSINQHQYYGAISTRFDSDKFLFIIDGGIQYLDNPRDKEYAHITYPLNENKEMSYSQASKSSYNWNPYFNGMFQLSRLPHNSLLYGGFSFSYNRNNLDSHYQLETQNLLISNGYNEIVYLPALYIGWMTSIYRQNYMTVEANANFEMYRTSYNGTNNSSQKLNNYNYTLIAQYSHSFSQKWNGKITLSLPIQSFKVNDNNWETTAYINGSASLNGRIDTRHSFYAQFSINQSPINPAYYNSVIRQDTELEGSKGNDNLKTMRQAYAMLSYTWMPSNSFSLNASIQWDNIINDIVPWWHTEGELMIKEMINSGNFNPLYLSLSPAVTLFDGKLNLSAKLSYIHEWHNGLYHINNGYFGFFPNMSYKINSHFLATVGYNATTGKGYMRGGSYLSKTDPYGLNMKIQYNSGNLFISVMANHILKRNGWWKSWFDSENLSQSSFLSRPWDGMFVTLSASYTFNFGNKSSDYEHLKFNGKIKSSAL